MPADRWTGERHNAAIFFPAAISTYRPPFLSAVDYRSFHECKKQLITATCHLRKIPSLSSRLCSHSFYDNLVHVLLLPSNISLLLTLNCCQLPETSQTSLGGHVYPNHVRSCFVKLCWWSENANEGLKSNQFTRLHSP